MPDREDSYEDRPAEPASDEASEASSRESRGGWPLGACLSAENVTGDISGGYRVSKFMECEPSPCQITSTVFDSRAQVDLVIGKLDIAVVRMTEIDESKISKVKTKHEQGGNNQIVPP